MTTSFAAAFDLMEKDLQDTHKAYLKAISWRLYEGEKLLATYDSWPHITDLFDAILGVDPAGYMKDNPSGYSSAYTIAGITRLFFTGEHEQYKIVEQRD